MRQAVEAARMGWACAPWPALRAKGETLDIVPRFLITGAAWRVVVGGVKGRDQVPELVSRWLAGDVDVDPLISHRITLDEVNAGSS